MRVKVNYVKLAIGVLLLFSTLTTIAQNTALKKFESEFEKLNYQTRLAELKKFKPNELSLTDQALFEHLSGKTQYLYNSGAGAVEHFVKARELYLKANDLDKAMEVAITIAEQKRYTYYKYEDYKELLDEAVDYAQKNNKPKLLSSAYIEVGINIKDSLPQEALRIFEMGKRIAQKNKFYIDEIVYDRRIAGVYFSPLKDYKKARYYHTLSFENSKKNNYQEGMGYAYANLGGICQKEGQNEKAIELYKKALDTKFENYRNLFNVRVYQSISDTYRAMGNYEKALEYRDKKEEFAGMSEQDETTIIRDINTKYETEKKELENKTLKIKDQKNKLIFYLFIGLFLVFLIGAYFRINYINKKKKIAEQEKLIESQKLENVLKDQELHEIDKMLEGQEKERLKIANDLHDNLGSILVTLKLNFQNLYQQKGGVVSDEKELYDKTNDLIEEAYQKVRGIAHAKNAGVIGSEGLVPAVQNIAKKVAVPNKIKVQVIPFGMTERLENTLEVTLFRMIQEILTNTIKHAEASEITISLTQDSDSINIIIEDNGKGFNPKTIDKKEGMGLSNMEKKAEQLNGTFSIDSFEGKGTTIIIDIPL